MSVQEKKVQKEQRMKGFTETDHRKKEIINWRDELTDRMHEKKD